MRKTFKFAAAGLLTLALTGLAATAFAADDAAPSSSGRLNLKEGTITSNVSVLGVSLEGMSLEDATAAALKPMETLEASTVRVESEKNPDHVYEINVPQLGVKWNAPSVEEQVASAVLSGKTLDRYKKAKAFEANPLAVDFGLEIDENHIRSMITEELASWNCEPVDAQFTARVGTVTEYSQNGKSREVIVTPGSNGYSYDFNDCIHEFVENVKAGKIEDTDKIVLHPQVSETVPNMTTERAQGFSVIGYCETEFARPNTQSLMNRMTNLVIGATGIDGHVYAPGEVISALAMYGDVNDPNLGYKLAGTYTTAGHNEELGGGLCQVTTTLYNAVLEAELDIDYRNHHSYTISYMEPGLDAMVYPQGGLDFRFINSTSDIIKLEATVDTVNQWIHIWIIGHEDDAPGHSVRYESVVDGVAPAPVTCQPDASLPVGWYSQKFREISYPLNQVTAHVIKHVYEDGVEVSATNLHGTDVYKPMPGILAVAPDVTVEAVITGNRSGHFTTLETKFVNGVSMGDSPAHWTPERRAEFNADMTARMAALGLEWPDKGSAWSFDGVEQFKDEMAPSESEGEGESGSEGEAPSGESETPAPPEETPAPPEETPAAE